MSKPIFVVGVPEHYDLHRPEMKAHLEQVYQEVAEDYHVVFHAIPGDTSTFELFNAPDATPTTMAELQTLVLGGMAEGIPNPTDNGK